MTVMDTQKQSFFFSIVNLIKIRRRTYKYDRDKLSLRT